MSDPGRSRIGRRHTTLALIAFHDLEAKIEAAGGDRDQGIATFLAQNDGEGRLLPETLHLANYWLPFDVRRLPNCGHNGYT